MADRGTDDAQIEELKHRLLQAEAQVRHMQDELEVSRPGQNRTRPRVPQQGNLAQPYEFSLALTTKQEHNHTTSTAIPRTPRLKLVDRKPTRSR